MRSSFCCSEPFRDVWPNLANICVYLAVCHQESWGREEVGVGGILLSPSSRWAAQPDPAGSAQLLRLSPRPPVARRGRSVSSAQPPHSPAGPEWTGGCSWTASSSSPPSPAQSTTYQQSSNVISPPLLPGLSMILCLPPPSLSPPSSESAEALSGQPAQALPSLNLKCWRKSESICDEREGWNIE